MKTLTPEILHSNYLMLLRFEHPGEPIKKWVEEEISYHGNYHTEVDCLWPLIDKIEGLGNQVTIATGKVEIEMCEDDGSVIWKLSATFKKRDRDLKLLTIYQTVVDFVTWYNEKQIPGRR